MNEQFERDPKTARVGHEILPFEMGYLPEFYQRKAEVELGDTPENRNKGLKTLKEMIKKDKVFNGITFDDETLLKYLRCRKFNEAGALSRLRSFVHIRNWNMNSFTNLSLEKISISSRRKIVTYLPYRCQDGCVIVLVKIGNWNPEEFPIEEVKRMVVVCILQALRDVMTQVNGFKFILDTKNTLRYMRYVTPTNIGLMYYFPVECVPSRIKAVHFVNPALPVRAGIMLVKHLITAKMRSRLIMHPSPEGLLDYFPSACMPVEYGGELEDYDMTDWLTDVMEPEKLETLEGGHFPTN